MTATKVVFRKFKEGGIIALFPTEPGTSDPYTSCMSYQHIGQHGAADPGIVSITKLATPKEYAPLAKELRSLGYVLDIRTKVTYDDMLHRKALINIARGK